MKLEGEDLAQKIGWRDSTEYIPKKRRVKMNAVSTIYTFWSWIIRVNF